MKIRVHEFGANKVRDQNIIALYRKVFGTYRGRVVLCHMLTELGFFSTLPPLDETKAAWMDYARRLLRLCGVWNEDYKLEIVKELLAGEPGELKPMGWLERILKLGLKLGSEGNPTIGKARQGRRRSHARTGK